MSKKIFLTKLHGSQRIQDKTELKKNTYMYLTPAILKYELLFRDDMQKSAKEK